MPRRITTSRAVFPPFTVSPGVAYYRFLYALVLAVCLLPACDRPLDLDDLTDGIGAWVHDGFRSIVVLSWEQHEDARVHAEYSFDDGVWLVSPQQDREEGPQEELLLGIPYETEVSFRLVFEADGEQVASEFDEIDTAPPPLASSAQVLASDPARWDPDTPYLLASIERWVVILDRQARIVWAYPLPAARVSLHARPSRDHTAFLMDHNSFWTLFDNGNLSEVYRVKVDGTVVDTYPTPGLHHPFTEIGDGSLVWGVYEGNNETLEKLTPTGSQVRISSCEDYATDPGLFDYCASNTIYWNEATDTFLFSLFSHMTIFEIDHDTGMPVRTFGYHTGSWDFDPPESAFWWQHGGHYTPTGTLLTSSYAATDSDELVVREYALDDETQTLREVWSFGAGQGVEGRYLGEAHRLPGGNTLHNYGTTPRVREVTAEGDVVWDVRWIMLPGRDLGRTTPLSDLYSFMP
jgi:hypothetical protein